MLLIKKLFKQIQQINWRVILLELFIVFVGVYLAFLLSTFKEKQRTRKEADKILTSLKMELEEIRYDFPGRAVYQRSRDAEWDSLWNKNEVGPFYNWRFIQPQYDFTTIEYALNTRETSIIDFTLYDRLTKLYQDIRQLQEYEVRITDISFHFKNIPSNLDKSSEEYMTRRADNRFLFFKFMNLSEMRGKSLDRIATLATNCLEVIDQKLGQRKRLAIEKDIIREQVKLSANSKKPLPPKILLEEIIKTFPHLSEGEIMAIIEEEY